MMYFLLFILLLPALFVLLLFYTFVTVKLEYSTNTNELTASLRWLNLLFAKVNVKSNSSSVSVSLSRIRIFSKVFQGKRGKKGSYWKYIRSLDLNDSFANVYYGLTNPFTTGIASGIVQMIGSCFGGIHISQFPDFMPAHEYVYINAGTELNMGKTLANIMRIKLENKRKRRDFAWSR